MSFRTNLQYLRAERHMTQEQLAMLVPPIRHQMGGREVLSGDGQAHQDAPDLRMLAGRFGAG